jgi:hypothetical protein
MRRRSTESPGCLPCRDGERAVAAASSSSARRRSAELSGVEDEEVTGVARLPGGAEMEAA